MIPLRSWFPSAIFLLTIRLRMIYGQKYDGEFCIFDNNCVSDSCVSNSCAATLPLTSISKNNETLSINANYVGNFHGSGGQSATDPTGAINLLRNARSIYTFDSVVTIDKFSRLQFDMRDNSGSQTSPTGKGFCLYNQADGETDFSAAEDVSCLIIGSSAVSSLNNVFSIESDVISLNGKLKNWALGKSTSQSSLYSTGYAQNAVDGNTNGIFNFNSTEANSVTSTSSEIEPWWEVDLQGTYFIEQIKIFKRLDGYSGRLLNFNIEIFNGNVQVFSRAFDDTQGEDVLSFNIKDESGVGVLMGSKVKISLNGNVARILSLAEVQVIGNTYGFEIPLGSLFNTPKREINHVAFIHDGGDESQTSFSNFAFVEMDTVKIASVDWIEGFDSSVDINIQGTNTVTRSEGGDYIGLRNLDDAGLKYNTVVFYYKSFILRYQDPSGQATIRALAIADNGIVIVSSFLDNGSTAVRILKVTENSVTLLQVKQGSRGMGSGVSISPAADKACIGDPVEGAVYIFNLSASFSLMQETKVTLIAPSNMRTSNFGEKVGLSSTGTSLAVAAPAHQGPNGETIGAVFLYLFDAETNRWEQMDSIIYGDDFHLGLGEGGVTASDVLGRVDANDNAGIRVSYKFTVVCSDQYAIPFSESGNNFEPKCECGEGRKSSNSQGGKLLRNRKDVCIPCIGTADCSREPAGPTTQPTPAPPTTKPTVISDAPSSKPTVYIIPTDKPTITPTATANTLYDGASCRYDFECIQNICEEYRCKAEKFSIGLRRSNDSPEETINAEISPSADSGGGVIVTPSNTLNMYGSVVKSYKTSPPILISKNTRLRFNLQNIDNAQGVYICFYQRQVEVDLNDRRCIQPDFLSQPSQDIVGFGEVVFGSSSSFVMYVTVVQSSGTSALSSVLISNENGGIFCGSECCDRNADKLVINGETSCVCRDGFVSSGGGEKILSLNEACASCQETFDCGLDGDTCETNGYCWFDNCSSGTCGIESFAIGIPDSADALASPIGNFADNSTDNGGLIISSDGVVSMYGDSFKIFELSRSVSFNKVTNMRFDFERVQDPNLNVGANSDSEFQVCLFEERDGDLLHLSYANDERRCELVSQASMNIQFGRDFFMNREASVKYIALKQSVNGFDLTRVVSVKVINMRVTTRQAPNQITNTGRCSDELADEYPNADQKCVCQPGYVSSNGGIVLEEFDACVPVIVPGGYDGDVCSMNRACLKGRCSSNKCYGNNMQITDYLDAQVDAVLSTELSSTTGGVMVDSTNTGKIDLHGSTTKIFELTTPIPFDRFTLLTFTYTTSQDATGLSICVYDSSLAMSCPLNCHSVENRSSSTLTIDAAKLLSYREANVRYFGFVQATDGGNEVTSSFNNIKVESGPTKSAYENGQCTDPNARDIGGPAQIIAGDEVKCICTQGYFSSNGGRLLRDQDACIPCLSQQCESPLTLSNQVCSAKLLIKARPGGLTGEPIPLMGTLLPAQFSPLVSGQGGGSEVNNETSVALYGGVSRTYALDTPYVVDKFSKLYFYLYAQGFEGFLAMCLNESVNPHNITTTLCFNFGGEDNSWDRTQYETYDFNLALSKPASHKDGNPDNDASYAVDGDELADMNVDDDFHPISKTVQTSFPWWEVNLEEEYNIHKIVVHFTKDRRVDILSDYDVEILTASGSLAYHYAGAPVSDPMTSPFSAEIVVPEDVNIVGTRVKIKLLGEGRILSLREVQVYEKKYTGSPTRLLNLPIGAFREGMKVNYVSFIQKSFNRKAVTNFQNLNFVYGFAQAATAPPTQSMHPTVSSAPSQSQVPSPGPTVGSTSNETESSSSPMPSNLPIAISGPA